jgi:hypothetical protein
MTINHLAKAIEACNNGSVQFTNQQLKAFSLGGKWYPLRAVVNYALQLARETSKDTNGCRKKIEGLKVYTEINEIKFVARQPRTIEYLHQIQNAQEIRSQIK